VANDLHGGPRDIDTGVDRPFAYRRAITIDHLAFEVQGQQVSLRHRIRRNVPPHDE